MVKERNYLIHPHFILIFLLIGSMCALFLGFSAAYLYNRVQSGGAPIKLPQLFYVNTLILIMSSYCLNLAKKAYHEDLTEKYQRLLLVTLVLSLLFLISQIFAWKSLITNEVLINHSNMASYIYVISGLHFLHVIAGIPFLAVFIITAYRKMKEPVSVLVYFSDPGKLRKLKILTIYWHFLDILWIYLVLFFAVNLLF